LTKKLNKIKIKPKAMSERLEVLRRAIDLDLAIYRLTEKLSKDEILVSQLRKIGNELVGDLILHNFLEAQKKIEILLVYFEVAAAQKWVKEINWLILEKEYQKLRQTIDYLIQEGERVQKMVTSRQTDNIVSHNIYKGGKKIRDTGIFNLPERQKKILTLIQSQQGVKMSDLIPLFKTEASERTLRNDLQILLDKNLIIRSGKRKSAIYFVK